LGCFYAMLSVACVTEVTGSAGSNYFGMRETSRSETLTPSS
jgi:hypothetical protein